ncbi:uncharacterized protein [Amphiura filiformis]|uniref:uncharacterized protein n=1 Tax=Amphiura filiformis TaxID=82378 RepID=UPI003B21D51D
MGITAMKIILTLFFSSSIVSTVVGLATNLPGYDVDVAALYEEAEFVADASMTDAVHQRNYDSNGDLTETYLHDFPHQVNVPEFDAIILDQGDTLRLGNFADLCTSCFDSKGEPLVYTFAMWISLKPNSLNDTQDSACVPIFGPVGMKFPALSASSKQDPANMLAKVNSGEYKMIESKRAKRLADTFMWNHYAVVVQANGVEFYCNGVPCNKNANQTTLTSDIFTDFNESNPEMLILNLIKSATDLTFGCAQVAYDKISLWDRGLTEEEILGLRFAPFRRITTTTERSEGSGGGGEGGGGGGENDPTTAKQQTESKVTGKIVIPLPTGKAEEQFEALEELFNTNNTDVTISAEFISAGVGVALDVLDGFLTGIIIEPDDNDESVSITERPQYEGPADEEIIIAIAGSEVLFNAMSAAGLTMPVTDGSSDARRDMLKFLNSLIAIDLETGGKDETHLDGQSLLVSLDSFMSTYFRQRGVPKKRSLDKYEHIHCYELARMDALATNVDMVLSKSRDADNVDVYMQYPSGAYDDYKYVRMIVCAVYDGVQLSLPKKISTSSNVEKTETVEVISPINSLLVNYDSSSLKENVSFLYYHREKLEGEETICSYLALDGTAKWKRDGCVGIDVNTTYTLCFCNHLTNFALLMATDGLVINSWHNQIATYLTYATLSISVICLIISLIILIVFKKALKSKRIRILRNTVLSMLLAHLLFLFGDFALANKTACKVVAACLHYLFLAVFSWMFMMGFQLYTKVRRATKTKVDFLYYLIFGWGFPLGIVGMSVATNTEGYGTVGACWLNPEDNTIWAFVGPALGILFFNCIVMILVMRAFVNVKVNKDKETMDQLRSAAKAVIVMLPILGLTWVVGLVVQYSLAFVYMFILFNGLQGLFLFIFHIVMNNEVKNAVKGNRNKVQATSGLTAAFGTTTTEGDADNEDNADIKG